MIKRRKIIKVGKVVAYATVLLFLLVLGSFTVYGADGYLEPFQIPEEEGLYSVVDVYPDDVEDDFLNIGGLNLTTTTQIVIFKLHGDNINYIVLSGLRINFKASGRPVIWIYNDLTNSPNVDVIFESANIQSYGVVTYYDIWWGGYGENTNPYTLWNFGYSRIPYPDDVTGPLNFYVSTNQRIRGLDLYDSQMILIPYPSSVNDAIYTQEDLDREYQRGLEDAVQDQFSFKSLIFSIIDAPFKVVRDALNFDLFGVNVGTLVVTFISLGLLAFAIKKLF